MGTTYKYNNINSAADSIGSLHVPTPGCAGDLEDMDSDLQKCSNEREGFLSDFRGAKFATEMSAIGQDLETLAGQLRSLAATGQWSETVGDVGGDIVPGGSSVGDSGPTSGGGSDSGGGSPEVAETEELLADDALLETELEDLEPLEIEEITDTTNNNESSETGGINSGSNGGNPVSSDGGYGSSVGTGTNSGVSSTSDADDIYSSLYGSVPVDENDDSQEFIEGENTKRETDPTKIKRAGSLAQGSNSIRSSLDGLDIGTFIGENGLPIGLGIAAAAAAGVAAKVAHDKKKENEELVEDFISEEAYNEGIQESDDSFNISVNDIDELYE